MVTSEKHCLTNYTYAEFQSIVKALIQAEGSPAWQDRLLELFIELVAHPAGSDLIYYPGNEEDGNAETVMALIVKWRESKGLSLFRDQKCEPNS
ncbi:bacteriocin immunity protein [Pseudomonas sp. NPDC008258]|uniref:bacteriocin immunity protein n=1 Tax=Pseudomonas sp. NPDC008258 TaxID=3364418 RepID=UPI0036F02B98